MTSASPYAVVRTTSASDSIAFTGGSLPRARAAGNAEVASERRICAVHAADHRARGRRVWSARAKPDAPEPPPSAGGFTRRFGPGSGVGRAGGSGTARAEV